MIEDSCGAANKVHRDMVAEVERRLGISLSDEEARQLIASVQCPYCGCSILKGVADAGRRLFKAPALEPDIFCGELSLIGVIIVGCSVCWLCQLDPGKP